jgi:Tfp pilus assembly pilus retraction ATPase PilT
MILQKILQTAVNYKASDIYVSAGSKPALRINGELVVIEEHPLLTRKMAEDYIFETMNDDQRSAKFWHRECFQGDT